MERRSPPRGLSITGFRLVWLASPFVGSRLTVGKWITNSSPSFNALHIGNTGICVGDTATALVNASGDVNVSMSLGDTGAQLTLDMTCAASFGLLGG